MRGTFVRQRTLLPLSHRHLPLVSLVPRRHRLPRGAGKKTPVSRLPTGAESRGMMRVFDEAA